jgi:signal transduction histidine kinase
MPKLSIKLKIILGLGFVASLFLLQYFLMKSALLSIDRNVGILTDTSNSSSRALQINRGISDIQRLVLAYSQTGGGAILRKLEKQFKEIRITFSELREDNQEEQSKIIFSDIEAVFKRYEESIDNLKELHRKKDQLIDVKLRENYYRGLDFIKNKKFSSSKRSRFLALWNQIHYHSLSYLIKRNFSSKREAMNSFRELDKLLQHKIINQYLLTFDKAVIANRNYLTLVNVVMSGDAAELSTLADKLESLFLRRLQVTKEQSRETIEKSSLQANLVLAFLVPFLIFIIFIYNRNIGRAISQITETFNDFLKNDFSQSVPGKERKDEIGQLALAAEKFKVLSANLEEEKENAQRLAKTKADFLANMSHEIRTPMNGILGMASLLGESELTSEQKEMIETINNCGEGLLTILNDILDLSKVESGAVEFEKLPIDLHRLRNEVEFLFKEVAKKNKNTLTVELKGDAPFILGDETRIKQILINLISNALKFTQNGDVDVLIEANRKGPMVETTFKVRDTGVGIAPENISKIFEVFSQSDSSTTRKFGGTGLGLTISQKLAHLMESKIICKSILNEGSVFSFSLICEEASPEKVDEKVVNDHSFENTKVLVVEDNEINIKVISKRLERLSVQFDVARNGEEGVAMAREHKYQIIFMDIQMPILDGFGATKLIRENDLNTPIVAMTANVQSEDQEMCFEVGMNAFLGKPINKTELIAILERFSF